MKRKTLILLLVLTVVGCGLRVWGIARQSLWFDEVFSQRVATHSTLGSILTEGVAGDVHPPLYFALLNLWVKLVGDSELGLRSLSAFFMMLALPCVYHLGRLLFNVRVGVVALGLAAFSLFQSYYAQEARQYSLSLLCGVASLVGLVGMVRGKRYGLPLYVIAGLAGVYTQYFNGLMLAAAHLWLILYAPARSRWKTWLIADVVIALLFLPQAIIAAGQTGTVLNAFWIIKPGVAQMMATNAYLLFDSNVPGELYVIIITLPTLALILCIFDVMRFGSREVRQAFWLCLIIYAGVLIPLLIYSIVASPLYLDRSFAFLSPVIVVMLAAGVVYARRPSLTPAIVGLVAVLMVAISAIYLVMPTDPKRPYRQIAAEMRRAPAPVLHIHDESYLPLRYYAPELTQRLGDLQSRSWLFPRTWEIFGVHRESQGELEGWLNGYKGALWLVAQSFADPPGKAMRDAVLARACQATSKTYNEFTTQPVTIYALVLC